MAHSIVNPHFKGKNFININYVPVQKENQISVKIYDANSLSFKKSILTYHIISVFSSCNKLSGFFLLIFVVASDTLHYVSAISFESSL